MADSDPIQAFFAAYEGENYYLAARLGKPLCEMFETEGWAWAGYGNVLSHLHRNYEAEAALLKAVKLYEPGKRRLPLGWLGHHYERVMRPAQARRAYLQAIADAPKHAHAYTYLGSLEWQLGNVKVAEQLLRRATKCTDGAIDEPWYNLAALMASCGRIAEAKRAVARALKIDPEYKIAKKLRRFLKSL